MRIGVGLPNVVPGTPGKTMVEWARNAEQFGFSSLATIGRLVFPSYEELISLTAAAAVTSKIGLLSNVTIGPTRNPIELAHEAASLDQISGGRFILGLAVGWRPEDFTAVDRPWKGRGLRLDSDIELMLRAWRGEILPGLTKRSTVPPVNGESVPLAFGGTAQTCYDRAAKYGVGWTAGGSNPADTRTSNDATLAAWKAAGRSGTPRLWALAYFGLGDGARDIGATYLTDYYGDWGGGMAAGMPADADALRATVKAYEAAGTDELFFNPTNPDLHQLEALAKAVLA
jgi:alkanesulfonate monooxygenase SsuD/methylene tetrahydromethanopterin reductase-like flavin-dependent oxidoreductase (luciferase family)